MKGWGGRSGDDPLVAEAIDICPCIGIERGRVAGDSCCGTGFDTCGVVIDGSGDMTGGRGIVHGGSEDVDSM